MGTSGQLSACRTSSAGAAAQPGVFTGMQRASGLTWVPVVGHRARVAQVAQDGAALAQAELAVLHGSRIQCAEPMTRHVTQHSTLSNGSHCGSEPSGCTHPVPTQSKPLACSAGTLPRGLTARNSAPRCSTLPRLMRTSSKGMPASLGRQEQVAAVWRPSSRQRRSGGRRQRRRQLSCCRRGCKGPDRVPHLQNSRQVREGCDILSTNSLSCAGASIVSVGRWVAIGACGIDDRVLSRPFRRANAPADSALEMVPRSGALFFLQACSPRGLKCRHHGRGTCRRPGPSRTAAFWTSSPWCAAGPMRPPGMTHGA